MGGHRRVRALMHRLCGKDWGAGIQISVVSDWIWITRCIVWTVRSGTWKSYVLMKSSKLSRVTVPGDEPGLWPGDLRRLDLKTFTNGDRPALLLWSIIGWTIRLRAFMNLHMQQFIIVICCYCQKCTINKSLTSLLI